MPLPPGSTAVMPAYRFTISRSPRQRPQHYRRHQRMNVTEDGNLQRPASAMHNCPGHSERCWEKHATLRQAGEVEWHVATKEWVRRGAKETVYPITKARHKPADRDREYSGRRRQAARRVIKQCHQSESSRRRQRGSGAADRVAAFLPRRVSRHIFRFIFRLLPPPRACHRSRPLLSTSHSCRSAASPQRGSSVRDVCRASERRGSAARRQP